VNHAHTKLSFPAPTSKLYFTISRRNILKLSIIFGRFKSDNNYPSTGWPNLNNRAFTSNIS
jgi:hypothetical protein